MWQNVTFTPPPAINDLAAGLGPGLNSFSAALQGGGAGLAGLGLPSLPTPPDTAQPLRAGAANMLATPAKYMALTPYQQGVGSRKGENAYLTPAEAISAALNRLGEVAGGLVPDNLGKSALILLLIAAPEPGQFASALGAFNAVYPIKELQRAQRRAGALATLETDKFKIPAAPAYPAWQEAAPLNNKNGQAIAAAAGEQLSLAEGLQAANAAPQDVLAQFGAKLQNKAQASKERLSALSAGLGGTNPGWFGMYLDGPIVDILRVLAKFAPPLENSYKCSALVTWAGRPGNLQFLKEAFGLQSVLP